MKELLKDTQVCTWADCGNKGVFPAPYDPKNLRKKIYLCEEHITLYNKSWNGLEGFSSDEIFSMQQNPSWDKPTWKLGQKQKLQEKIFGFTHSREKDFKGFDFIGDDFDKDDLSSLGLKNKPKLVSKQMQILGVEPPLNAKTLKKAYKNKVKENHPDRHEDKIAAEKELKKINIAYHSLKKHL